RRESGCQHQSPIFEFERLGKQPGLRLQKAIEFPRVAYGGARHAAFHPAPKLDADTVPEHRPHSKLAHLLQGPLERIKAAEAFELELAKTDIGYRGGTFDIRNGANWLIEHDWHC